MPTTIRWNVAIALLMFQMMPYSSAFIVHSRRSTTSSTIETPQQKRAFLPLTCIDHAPQPRSHFGTSRGSHHVNGRRAAATAVRQLHPTTPTTVGAAAALAGSSLVGLLTSRWIPSGSILGTLMAAACFGNLFSGYVPTSHPLYDLSFTLFLPGSLTLLLLAYQPPPTTSGGKGSENGCDSTARMTTDHDVDAKHHSRSSGGIGDGHSIAACVGRVAVPFAVASASSLVGCWLAYLCAVRFRWFASAGTATATANQPYARAAAGCLSASYVGGSVNCMATARWVGAPPDLLGSLVTADLFTMAIYFSFLSSSLDWDWLVSKFAREGAKKSTVNSDGPSPCNDLDGKGDTPRPPRTLNGAGTARSAEHTLLGRNPSLRSMGLASIPLLLGTYGIVRIANRVEGAVGRWIPGTSCAVIAVVAPLLNSFASANGGMWWKPFGAAANPLSEFFFLSFFASIGIAANLSSALSMGPACLLFSAVALAVHVVGTVGGCLLWKQLVTRGLAAAIAAVESRSNGNHSSSALTKLLRLVGDVELEDVWIASNAAIGGPATAAAFCGARMTKRSPGKLRGRTISATVWGVVGYAIGTVLGVGMFRLLGGR
jgi:uncharacterized membrane protein